MKEVPLKFSDQPNRKGQPKKRGARLTEAHQMKKCKTEAKQKMAPFTSVQVEKKSPPAATIIPQEVSKRRYTAGHRNQETVRGYKQLRRVRITISDSGRFHMRTTDIDTQRTVTTELVREFDKVDTGNQTETQEETGPGPLEEMRRAQNERIMLNVGGRMFTTSRGTLSRCRYSLLFKLINSARPFMRVEDNLPVYFIDRDPTHFQAMLHFLRDGAISVAAYLPKDPIILKQVHQEAVFYGEVR